MRTFISIILIGVFAFYSTAYSQDKKDKTRLKLYISKLPDGSKKLTAGLLAGKGKDMQGVSGAEIEFAVTAGDSSIILANVPTDKDGNAILMIEPGYKFPMDEEGKSFIEASFQGSDLYGSSSNDLEVIELSFDITFEEEDSIKYLYISANKLMPDGEMFPVEALDINIGAVRLFSTLPLGEAETDEDGVATFEFPNDVPGDSAGVLIVAARIEDHDEFGTVEQQAKVNWGVPVSYDVKLLSRQLWTDEAPLWMIISVFVILVGAWYHFFLSIYKLRKIRNYKESNA